MMDLLFKDCLSNQTYRSKTIQNEIIEICGAYISDAIVSEIKKAKYFSILAIDCFNVEQLAIVLRFVDDSLKIREEFVAFFRCKHDLSGE